MIRLLHTVRVPWRPARDPDRRGVFTPIAAVSLFAVLGFVALGVDLGLISLTRARMQFATDAAALAAAHELSDVVAEGEDPAALDAEMAGRARAMAVKVAGMNETFVDDDLDVRLGRRVYDGDLGRYRIVWGSAPYNVVEVSARKENPDVSAPDGQMPAFFSRIFGLTGHSFRVSSIAYTEPRDLVLVLDYSGSMNDDSEFPAFDRLGEAAVTENMLAIYDALGLDDGLLPDVPERVTLHGVPENTQRRIPHITFTPGPWGGQVTSTADIDRLWVLDNGGRWTRHDNVGRSHTFSTSGYRVEEVRVRSWRNDREFGEYGERIVFNTENTLRGLGLDGVDYSFPGGSWSEFFWFMEHTNTAYRAGQLMEYGKPGLVSYILAYHPSHAETPDLWKAPAQPFHAMKEGVTQLTQYLDSLGYGDHLGLVSYDTTARWETRVNDPDAGMVADVSDDPITMDYAAIDTIQRHRQAGYYRSTTGLGDGVREAQRMLAEHGRYGARPTILVMTDGNANVSPSGFSLPSDWNWDELTDFDGDGAADYTTGDRHKQYAFYHAREAIRAGATVHTLSVGAGADSDLMNAMGYAGSGVHIDVPGGNSSEENEELLREAFRQIAARVPPPRLMLDRDAE
ncbi:pilus assembly protein TadG-related protein [Alienimonas sp. DA493]|uniref:pilus assembly protein TadG-related protein n=1 Tax=Alienimonas sp. DA493 TaxID=3373605 RepID=UPI003754DE78